MDGSSSSGAAEVEVGAGAHSRARWRLRQAVAPLLCLVAAVTSLVALGKLPYSTSLIGYADPHEASKVPGQTFELGSLRWDLDTYRRAPSLNVFRDTFNAPCGRFDGVEAARCVLDIVRAKSANGEPGSEFVDAQFDPAAVLTAHLNGAPGHCTSRSFMTATALLAMGKPARIAQLLASSSEGHNVIEVYDPALGWLLFDPHYESSVLRGDDFVSSVMLTQVGGGLRWRRPKVSAPDPNVFAGSTISFPEPWLYTRVGERCATWPFRGCFEQIGPLQFTNGPAQKLALMLFMIFSGLTASLTIRAVSRRSA